MRWGLGDDQFLRAGIGRGYPYGPSWDGTWVVRDRGGLCFSRVVKNVIGGWTHMTSREMEDEL